MRFLTIFFMLIAWIEYGFGQKSKLDTSVITIWPILNDESKISNDGKYVVYGSYLSYPHRKGILKIQSLDDHKEIKFNESDGAIGLSGFSSDSKYFVFGTATNSVQIYQMDTKRIKLIPSVKSFVLNSSAFMDWLIYRQNDGSDKLIFRSLQTGKEQIFYNVAHYQICPDKNILLLVHKRDNGDFSIQRVELLQNQATEIWKGQRTISELTSSRNGNHIAFKAGNFYFKYDVINRSLKKIELHQHIGSEFSIVGIRGFSHNGNLLFMDLSRKRVMCSFFIPEIVKVFSYQDPYFELNNDPTRPEQHIGVCNFTDGSIISIVNPGEQIAQISHDEKSILIFKMPSFEYYWNQSQVGEGYLLTFKARKWSRRKIATDIDRAPLFSRDNAFIIYQKSKEGDFFSCHICTGKIINLTGKLPIPQFDNSGFESLEGQKSRRIKSAGGLNPIWLDRNHLLVKDHYDLWSVDVTGLNAPTCLTNGYGRKNNLDFNSIIEERKELIIELKRNLVIVGFNEETMDIGYYKIQIGKNPLLLSSGQYGALKMLMKPLKAQNANVWLLSKCTSTSSPNLYWTKDFKSFQSISYIYPEKNYNWYTTELINYRTKDGRKSKAILYKPEKFDASKKYPVLFNFYEQETSKLNLFRQPGFTDHYFFNYPLMIAQDYLICVPDIHFEIGNTANNIVDYVEAAAEEIAKRPYVDSTKFGAAGGSFGGYGVNCLAALSTKFKALISVSGVSNVISQFGNVPGLKDEIVENRQMRMGVSLGSDPDRYLRNSPIAYSKKVSSPMLIVVTLGDLNVNVQQGVEWFNSLRREGKRSWMLQYQEKDHGIWKLEHQKDLYGKMKDFFGYYLQDKPAPSWMTNSMFE